MDLDFEHYILRYFSHLMTADEQCAHGHLMATLKFTGGRSDIAAQQEARRSRIYRNRLSNDPDVLRLASHGFEEFRARTASRILAEHGERLFLNRCPRCAALARTPTAKQCRFCGHDWHDSDQQL